MSDETALPTRMTAMVLTGHGGYEQLSYRTDFLRPSPLAGEVLIRVGAAGINNTDINTRIGWYSDRAAEDGSCLLYTSPSPRDVEESRMPSSA